MTEQQANNINSLVYLVSGIASPVLGLFIDKIGKNISWIILAISVTITSHSLLAFTTVNPYIGMVIFFFSF